MRQYRSCSLAGCAFGVLAVLVWASASLALPAQDAQPTVSADYYAFLPFMARPEVPPTPTPSPTATATATATATEARFWDPRLTLRGAELITAQVSPGQGYWRLVKAVWYDENEAPFEGQHHIFVDALTVEGIRQTGVPVRIAGMDGLGVFEVLYTEQKSGELYAANYPMYSLAPAYRAEPGDGQPADALRGMGYGCLTNPAFACHTSYGLTWQWSVVPLEQPAASVTPSATSSAGAATATPTDPGAILTVTPSPLTTATPTATLHPAVTPSATPTTPGAAGLVWDPRLTQRGTVLLPAQVQAGQGYWRLVRAVWYDEDDPPFQTQHHIFFDTLDSASARQTGTLLRLSTLDGQDTLGYAWTEAKPGEPYAGSFAMNSAGPSYRVQPWDSAPADIVYGMGLGSLEFPNWAMLTSYGFTWQWSIAQAGE